MLSPPEVSDAHPIGFRCLPAQRLPGDAADHPADAVTADNWSTLAVGRISNVNMDGE